MVSSPLSSTLCMILIFFSCAWAGPFPIYARNETGNSTGVSQTVFDNLQYFAQYSAASYESVNSDNAFKNGKEKLNCPKGHGCPKIEQNDVYKIYGFENNIKTGVKGFVAIDKTRSLTVVAFRGSVSIMNWITDLRANTVKDPSKIHSEVKNEKGKNALKGTNNTIDCSDCLVHEGFLKSWEDARRGVMDTVDFVAKEYPKNRIILTGHSAGGSVAALAAAEIKEMDRIKKNEIQVDLYSYGGARIGGKKICDLISSQGGGDIYRVTHLNDMVPQLPPKDLLMYKYDDFGPEYYISTKSKEEVKREDISRYGLGDKTKGNGRWGWTELNPFESHWYYFDNVLDGMPKVPSLWRE